MKTHASKLREKIWRVWITDESLTTHVGEMESLLAPTHYEILDIFETLPSLFRPI